MLVAAFVTWITCVLARATYNAAMDMVACGISALNRRADRLGEAALRLAEGIGRFPRFVGEVLAAGARLRWLSRPAVMHVLVRQIYFTGVQGLPWVTLMAATAGVATVYSIVTFAHGLDDLALIGVMVNHLLVREMAPLLVSVFLLTRSGVAVAAEIGTMHVRGEDLLLRSLSVDAREYLHFPRMFAFSLCGLILTAMFIGIAIWVGGLAVAMNHEMNFVQFLIEVRRGTTLDEVLMMTLKGAGYPLLCCGMLLFQSCRVGRNPNQIPVRATYGVLGSLMLMMILDVVFVVAGSLP